MEKPKLKKTEKHTIDVVIERIKVNVEIKQRLVGGHTRKLERLRVAPRVTVGTPYCPGHPENALSVSQMVGAVLAMPDY